MKNCRVFLLTAVILAITAQAAFAAGLNIDFYAEWLWPNHPYALPGWNSHYVYAYGGVDSTGASPYTSSCAASEAGITITLDGKWGGRTRNLRGPGEVYTYGYPRGDGVIDDRGYPGYGMEPVLGADTGAVIGSMIFPYDEFVGGTITIEGLKPNVPYQMELTGWEQGNNSGYDISANGVLVADDEKFYSIGTVEDPLADEDVTASFETVADGAGVVVLLLSDVHVEGGYTGCVVGGLTMIPEPGSLVLLLGLAGLGLVAFLRRK